MEIGRRLKLGLKANFSLLGKRKIGGIEDATVPVHIVTHASQLPSEFLNPSADSQLVVGFDCEGIDLCRAGGLCLMQIHLSRDGLISTHGESGDNMRKRRYIPIGFNPFCVCSLKTGREKEVESGIPSSHTTSQAVHAWQFHPDLSIRADVPTDLV
ncbi:hypothetical protein MA16_Dca006659 [Dendrobium catenatum]|uniref:Uncharacterized protein n=1 Tax=Dendrobium catenatum TaxID=906689 RepID=A0A2I0X5Q8_9ASPA|nr:hypothetical protein MA16_Dca006659 [Dendrobium catenatum]